MSPSSHPVRLRDRIWEPETHEGALRENRWEGTVETRFGVMGTKTKRKIERKTGTGKVKENGSAAPGLNLPMDFRSELKDVPAPK